MHCPNCEKELEITDWRVVDGGIQIDEMVCPFCGILGDKRQQIDDSERADAEERGTPDYDNLGFLRGFTPPTDPADL
jgi:hypothetical protein